VEDATVRREKASLALEIREKVFLSLDELESLIETQTLTKIQEALEADLTIQNPVYQQARRFSRRRFVKAPKEMKFFHLRKPKTKPSFEVPIGYLPKLCQLLKFYQIPYHANDLLVRNPREFNSRINLHDYQSRALNDLMTRHRGVLVAPCGSGKTIMAMEALSRRSQKTLILVHTLDLLKQWKERVQEFLEIQCGVIGDRKKEWQEDIVVATVQTLIRDKSLVMKLKEDVGTLIVDECHHTPATTFHKIVGQMKPCYLYGFSATPKRQDGLSEVMHFFLGPTLHTILSSDLQKKKQLLRPELKIILTDFFFAYDREDPESYHQLMESLVTDKERNELIIEELLSHSSGSNLILSQRVAHCLELHDKLQSRLPEGSISAVVTGQTGKEEREELLSLTREGKINYLFSTQLADEGLDIRRLENVWLACPSRNTARIEQRLGRVMRTHEEKSRARVFDFVDWNTRVLLNQFKTRYLKVHRRLLDFHGELPF